MFADDEMPPVISHWLQPSSIAGCGCQSSCLAFALKALDVLYTVNTFLVVKVQVVQVNMVEIQDHR